MVFFCPLDSRHQTRRAAASNCLPKFGRGVPLLLDERSRWDLDTDFSNASSTANLALPRVVGSLPRHCLCPRTDDAGLEQLGSGGTFYRVAGLLGHILDTWSQSNGPLPLYHWASPSSSKAPNSQIQTPFALIPDSTAIGLFRCS